MKCILVVDDSPANLKFVESVLNDQYKLVLVKSGEKALTYLDKNSVDLVLLDIMMPEMDGFEVYDRIKELDLNHHVPVIFLTADADVDNEIKGLKMGAADFIKKPFVPEVMLNRINRTIQLDELKRNLENTVKEKTVQIEQLSEAQKAEALDYLTGLLGRKEGEKQIEKAIKEKAGCLAFIDLDNLKRTNDTMGHLAGDYALKTVGDVLSQCGENTVVSRLGGDEFLLYMKGVDKDGAAAVMDRLMKDFDHKKEKSTYLSVSSLSIGLCMTTPADTYADIIKKADRALYHVKQSGKCGYYFYNHDVSQAQQKNSVDLSRLVSNLKEQGAYNGSLSVEYREFAKIYDYIRHLGERYDYNIQLIMITLEAVGPETLYVDEREYVMTCMEKTIQDSLRSVDVSTRFSSEQFVVILLNAQIEYIEVITKRIEENFHKAYSQKQIRVSFDAADLSSL